MKTHRSVDRLHTENGRYVVDYWFEYASKKMPMRQEFRTQNNAICFAENIANEQRVHTASLDDAVFQVYDIHFVPEVEE